MTLLTVACPFYELLYTVVIVGGPVTQTGQKIRFRLKLKVRYPRFVCVIRNKRIQSVKTQLFIVTNLKYLS